MARLNYHLGEVFECLHEQVNGVKDDVLESFFFEDIRKTALKTFQEVGTKSRRVNLD